MRVEPVVKQYSSKNEHHRKDLTKKSESLNSKIKEKVSISKEATKISKDSLQKNLTENQIREKIKKENLLNKSSEVKKIKKIEPKEINKPGVFFITGFSLFSSNSSTRDGIADMAKGVRGSRLYAWDQKDEIIEQIKKRPPNQPIAMIGHSFGSDTAIEIANELNTVENGFKKIDLIVSLDSVGFNNDIIPQNVAKNMNFISDVDWFYNDGPNIAKNRKITEVQNDLRSEGHMDLDDTSEIQFSIVSEINSLLKNS